MTHITFDPYIPLTLWAPLAIAAASLLAWYARASRTRLPPRRWKGMIALMSAAIVLPLGILLNPTWLDSIPPPPGKPLLTVLVDRSASMATEDAEQGGSRYADAARCAVQIGQSLKEQYEVRVREFADHASSSDVANAGRGKADGATTDLSSAIEESIDANRPQGQAIVLLSDGIHNGPGGMARLRDATAKSMAMAAPIYTAAFGGESQIEDIEVSLRQPEELAFVEQRAAVVASVRLRGSAAPRIRLSLMSDGKTIEEREVKLVANGAVEEVFSISQKDPGLYRFEVRAEAVPGEVTDLNNTAVVMLRVVNEPIRVLLLEGKPYWDTKFLIRTLSTDPSIDLTSVVQLKEGRLLERRISGRSSKADQEENAPSGETAPKDEAEGDGTENSARGNPPAVANRNDQWTIQTDATSFLGAAESLSKYQIVVLGRDSEVFLTEDALVRLKKWLAQGNGSLVCFRGPPASQMAQRLGELMPVRWAPGSESHVRLQLTGAGAALRWLPGEGDSLADMPLLTTNTRPEKPKALSVVLAEGVSGTSGEQTPLITYQPVGEGRVVVVEGAGMWRWAFLSPQLQQRDEIYGTFWRSLTRWLVSNIGLLPSQKLSLRTDRVTFSTTESASANLLLREGESLKDAPEIELTGGPLEEPRRIAPVPRGGSPGDFVVPFGVLPEGSYRARVADAIADVSAVAAFDVRGNLKERLDVCAQPNVMAMIAENSGGAVLAKADAAVVSEKFGEHLGQTRPARTVQTMAWDRWWMLLASFALWATCWGVRRWSGLV